MSQLNSKELLQNIRDAINAPKTPQVGIDYFTPALYYAAINLATLTERERIIKLLDTDFWHHRIIGENGEITCLPSCDMCKLIALIKGENK